MSASRKPKLKVCRDQAKLPSAPAGLSAEGKIAWREQVEAMDEAGGLAGVDLGDLADYCEAWATVQRTTIALRKEGMVLRCKTGRLRANPLCKVRDKATRTMLRLTKPLGLGAVERARRAAAERLKLHGRKKL